MQVGGSVSATFIASRRHFRRARSESRSQHRARHVLTPDRYTQSPADLTRTRHRALDPVRPSLRRDDPRSPPILRFRPHSFSCLSAGHEELRQACRAHRHRARSMSAFHPAPKANLERQPSIPVGLYAVRHTLPPRVGELVVIMPHKPLVQFFAAGVACYSRGRLLKHILALTSHTICRNDASALSMASPWGGARTRSLRLRSTRLAEAAASSSRAKSSS
jgi:hypothetical protein